MDVSDEALAAEWKWLMESEDLCIREVARKAYTFGDLRQISPMYRS
jgi:hypothetical protein